MTLTGWTRRTLATWIGVALLLLTIGAPLLHAADSHDDFDAYTVRINGSWFYSNPSGSFQGSSENGVVNLQKDLAFNSYSTFAGKLDWKFTRKNHFYFVGSSFDQSRSVTINRTIVYQGQTFDAGVVISANLSAPMFAPGYQYDIIRRKRGHLGIGVQLDIFDTSAALNAAAQITGDGVHHAAVSAKGSLVAPIPVAGPQFRVYLTNSPRVFIEGNLYGMYLFGYGNFVSSAANLGFTLSKHLSLDAGYQLGSRLVVTNNGNDRIGVHLTQKGPTAGLAISF